MSYLSSQLSVVGDSYLPSIQNPNETKTIEGLCDFSIIF